MRNSNSELWYALLAIVLITLVYTLTVIMGVAPASSGLLGHLLGVVGFVLMLMTETLYALRKRSERARWGSMASWLKFHIFTGIVGPYMVLLHTAWHFNGLAGAVALLTLVVVASGFLGRYIYTAVPRTTDGVELSGEDLESQLAAIETDLQPWLAASSEASRVLSQRIINFPEASQSLWSLVLGRVFLEWGYRWQWWREKHRLKGMTRRQVKELGRLLQRRRELYYQVASLALTRQVLALWHSAHVPIGIALFTAAFIHIGAALYYAMLGR